MEQTSIVRNLATWITANPWHPLLTVLYDLCSYGVQRGALYMGEREKGRGRQTQVTQADIAANAKNASTPPLDTGSIGFELPTGIGNRAWIVRVEFVQTPFPQTVDSPQHKIVRGYSCCRQSHDNGKGGIFCFPQFC